MKTSSDLINNDVPAVGQLGDDDCVSFGIAPNADVKIAFLGNSITRHGAAESLGWHGDHGMAASRKENDYVHRLVARVEQTGKRASYCVANLSEWERAGDLSMLKSRYAAVKNFGANIVIVRLGENARLTERLEEFESRYAELVEYFSADAARTVLTDLFWEYAPFDGFVKRFADEKGCAFVKIHDLGNDDGMKATGLFSHAGVAAHPGDKGMEEIAKRIFAAIYGGDKST